MKKILRVIKFFVLGMILGVIISFLIYHSTGKYLINSILSIPWYAHLLLFLLTLIVNIGVHEIAHFIVAKKNKLKVKAVYIFIFVFYLDENDKFKFKVSFKLAKLIGGLVMIIPPEVSNETELDHYIIKTKKTILAGPVASVAFGIIMFLLLIGVLFLRNFVLSGLFINVSIFTILFSVLIYKASKLSYKGLYGDFVLYKRLDESKLLKMTFVVSNIKHIKYNQYTMNELKHTLLVNKNLINNSGFQNLAITYIEIVLKDNNQYDSSLEQVLNIKPIKIKRDENGFIFMNYLYLHHYQLQNFDIASEYKKYLTTKEFDVNNKIKTFWNLYTEALINNNQTELIKLKSKEYYYPNSTSWIINIILNEKHLITNFEFLTIPHEEIDVINNSDYVKL